MKFKNIFWGLILILIGTLLIGRNLNLFYFDWYNFVRLWPILFVLWGISVLPVRDIVKVVLLVLVLAGSTWFVIDGPRSSFANRFEYRFFEDSDNNNSSVTKYTSKQNFDIPYDSTIKHASVTMDAAAGSFYIEDNTDHLLDFEQRGSGTFYKYKYFVENMDDRTNVKIKEDRNHEILFDSHNKRRVTVKLNTNPVWDINLDAGASAVHYDLTPFKVRNLDLDGGAGSFKITLGDKYPETHVKLDAGASSITIKVPEQAGCDLRISAVLSGKNISGFEKLNNGHYQTKNYDTAKQKISMDVDAAVSSFTIIRY
jgi:hypothetical protein